MAKNRFRTRCPPIRESSSRIARSFIRSSRQQTLTRFRSMGVPQYGIKLARPNRYYIQIMQYKKWRGAEGEAGFRPTTSASTSSHSPTGFSSHSRMPKSSTLQNCSQSASSRRETGPRRTSRSCWGTVICGRSSLSSAAWRTSWRRSSVLRRCPSAVSWWWWSTWRSWEWWG